MKIFRVEVGFREPVGRWMKLFVVLRLRQPEGIQVGMKVAAHPVGPDHHQRADRIARRLLDIEI